MKSKVQKDQLFTLVKSLTKAEKRNFKLYTNRLPSGSDTKFLQLFDVLDKLQDYDEALIIKRIPGVQKKHMANLKRHLYKQILISLRLIYIQKNIDIQIREQLDFARILYTKGMYMQSLRILDRIKKIAIEHNQDLLHLEIVEFQKMIEARHITRSRMIENKMEQLLNESKERSRITLTTSKLSNLNIKIHGYYIQEGVVRNDEDIIRAHQFFQANLPEAQQFEQLTFFERIHLYQARMWYNYILLNFRKCRDFAGQWVNLFSVSPQMKTKDPDLYMRGLYYLLTFLYFEKDLREFEYYLNTFEECNLKEYKNLNQNSQSICFVYLNLSKLNHCILKKDFRAGIKLIPDIEQEINKSNAYTDIHRTLLFYYKFAYFYFCCGEFEKALDYLNEIIHLKGGTLRMDLHFNSRLLHLIVHYQMGNYNLVDYLIPSIQRAFTKSKDTTKTQLEILYFIKGIIKLPPTETLEAFTAFKYSIQPTVNDFFEQKAILYLDIMAWIESKIQDTTIEKLASLEDGKYVNVDNKYNVP